MSSVNRVSLPAHPARCVARIVLIPRWLPPGPAPGIASSSPARGNVPGTVGAYGAVHERTPGVTEDLEDRPRRVGGAVLRGRDPVERAVRSGGQLGDSGGD